MPMIANRLLLCLALGTGLSGLVACGNAADQLGDAELRVLLRSPGADANDPAAPVDRTSVECLVVWSGEHALMQDVPASMDTGAGKANCRQRIEGWLMDTTRNPRHLSFGDVTTASVARRALALLNTPATPAQASTAASRRPEISPARAAQAAKGVAATTTQTFNTALGQYDALCREAGNVAAKSKSVPMRLNARINGCLQRGDRLRAQMSAASGKGNAFETSMIAQNAQRMVTSAQRLVDEARKAAGK
jgi:hypothetical protein